MAITKQQIIEAAEQLSTDGVNPSMAAVRKQLGGGSFATISPVLREWRSRLEETTAVILEMPGEIKQAVEAVGAKLWQKANQLAGQEIEKNHRLAREQVETVTDERDEAIKEIEWLKSQIATLNVKLDDQQQKMNEMHQHQTEAARREGQLEAKLKAAKSELETKGQEIKEQKTEIYDLKQQNLEQQKAYAHLQGEMKATLQTMKRKQK